MNDLIMIDKLTLDQSTLNFQSNIGKVITKLALDEEKNILRFDFEDGSMMFFQDTGQDCCENRYMRTDDNLNDYIGATLVDGELRETTTQDGDYGDVHDIQFLVIKTTKGQFTMSSHNEHNGYYGGFSLWIGVHEPE